MILGRNARGESAWNVSLESIVSNYPRPTKVGIFIRIDRCRKLFGDGVGNFSYIDSDINDASIAGSPEDEIDSSGASEDLGVSAVADVSGVSSGCRSSSLLSRSVTVSRKSERLFSCQ